MGWIDFLILAVIAAICGSMAQALAGYSRGGCFLSMVLGFIGAVLGLWIARQMHLPELFAVNVGGVSFPVVWSVIGAALFVAVINLISGRRV